MQFWSYNFWCGALPREAKAKTEGRTSRLAPQKAKSARQRRTRVAFQRLSVVQHFCYTVASHHRTAGPLVQWFDIAETSVNFSGNPFRTLRGASCHCATIWYFSSPRLTRQTGRFQNVLVRRKFSNAQPPDTVTGSHRIKRVLQPSIDEKFRLNYDTKPLAWCFLLKKKVPEIPGAQDLMQERWGT